MIGIIIISLISYLLGSIPFSQIAASLEGKDLSKLWDGNIGITNLQRNVKSKLAISISFLGDISKGFISVPLSKYMANYFGENIEIALFVSSFFVIIGHIFSIFLKFNGGMGQLTAIGLLLYSNFLLALFSILIKYIDILFFYEISRMKNLKEKFISNDLASIFSISLLTILVSIYSIPSEYKIIFYGAALGVFIGYIKRFILIKSNNIPILSGRGR